MSQTRSTTVVISSICAEKKSSSYTFYFMSKILYCCTAALFPFAASDGESLPRRYFPSSQPFRRLQLRVASAALFSVVAALRDFFRRRNLSPPPAANRFRDFIFRRRSLSSTPRFHDFIFHRRSLSSTLHDSFPRRSFHRLRPQVASATSSSAVAAFRRLLPSTQPFVDSSLPRLHIPSS